MKILKTRWFAFLSGCLLGGIIGGGIVIKGYNLYWNQYEVGEPFLRVVSAMKTIHATEENDDEFIYSHHQLLLRNSFLLLIRLHETGDYKRQEQEIVKLLRRAKSFMDERPDMFMDRKFYPLPHSKDEDLNTANPTEMMQTLLKEGFDYVENLPQDDV